MLKSLVVIQTVIVNVTNEDRLVVGQSSHRV